MVLMVLSFTERVSKREHQRIALLFLLFGKDLLGVSLRCFLVCFSSPPEAVCRDVLRCLYTPFFFK